MGVAFVRVRLLTGLLLLAAAIEGHAAIICLGCGQQAGVEPTVADAWLQYETRGIGSQFARAQVNYGPVVQPELIPAGVPLVGGEERPFLQLQAQASHTCLPGDGFANRCVSHATAKGSLTYTFAINPRSDIPARWIDVDLEYILQTTRTDGAR